MGFLDDAVNKAKETIDVVGKKTGEVVNTQKQKFDISALENKREKDFAALGRLYFEGIDSTDGLSDAVKTVIEAIQAKNNQIAVLQAELAKMKKRRICPNCGASIDQDSIYCNACGVKVIIESAE